MQKCQSQGILTAWKQWGEEMLPLIITLDHLVLMGMPGSGFDGCQGNGTCWTVSNVKIDELCKSWGLVPNVQWKTVWIPHVTKRSPKNSRPPTLWAAWGDCMSYSSNYNLKLRILNLRCVLLVCSGPTNITWDYLLFPGWPLLQTWLWPVHKPRFIKT